MGGSKIRLFIIRASLACVLGYATVYAIGLIGELPYNSTREQIMDALLLPGVLISFPLYPQGLHTYQGRSHWGLVVILGNVITYSMIWFWMFVLLHRMRVTRRGRAVNDHVE